MPKWAVSGMLAVLLLSATTLSASHAIHQYLHGDYAGSGHFCLVCSLVKGQVSVAAVALISAALVFCYLWCVCLVSTVAFPGFDYHTSPSRAPPLL